MSQTPFAFLLPAEATPIVRPYLQLRGTPGQSPIYHLSGKQGALAYEQLRGAEQTPAEVGREASQQRLGFLVFVALLVIGGAAGRMKGGRHLKYADHTPMTNLLITMLDKVGVKQESLGDSSGLLSYL